MIQKYIMAAMILASGALADADSSISWSSKRGEILHNVEAGYGVLDSSSSSGRWTDEGERLKNDIREIQKKKQQQQKEVKKSKQEETKKQPQPKQNSNTQNKNKDHGGYDRLDWNDDVLAGAEYDPQ